jgi:glucokinase
VFDLLYLVAERELAAGRSLALEANFTRGKAEPRFAALPPHRLVQVWCSAPPEVLLERYRARQRHPGHRDAELVGEVAAAIRDGRHGPLDLPGDVFEVETSGEVDVDALQRDLQRRA